MVCFRRPVNEEEFGEVKELLKAVGEVVREGCGYRWEGVCLAVVMPTGTLPRLVMGEEEWEDVCQECGFEFVDFEKVGRNEFSGM